MHSKIAMNVIILGIWISEGSDSKLVGFGLVGFGLVRVNCTKSELSLNSLTKLTEYKETPL